MSSLQPHKGIQVRITLARDDVERLLELLDGLYGVVSAMSDDRGMPLHLNLSTGSGAWIALLRRALSQAPAPGDEVTTA